MKRILIFLLVCTGVNIAPTVAADFLMYVSGNNSLTNEAISLYNLVSSYPTHSSNRVIATIKTTSSNTFLVRGKGQAITTSLPISDYGVPDTLKDFLSKAEQYRTNDVAVLVLWGHGTSWYPENNYDHPTINRAIGRDALFGNALFFDQISEKMIVPFHYDIVVADACHYASTETIYAFRKTADYFIGSGHLIPANAFDYSEIFSTTAATSDAIITTFFGAFHPYDKFSLSAVHIPSFCAAMRAKLSSFPFQNIDRTALLGIDSNDTYSANSQDIDIYPFFNDPEWLIRHSTSESSLMGISLFFPPNYTNLKLYFYDYYSLSFQKDTDILRQLTNFYNKDEIPPIIEKSPSIIRYKNSIQLSDALWYDTSEVVSTLIGVLHEYKFPLEVGIINNSGYAGLQSGVVKINVTDSAIFNHGPWSTKGFISFTVSYTLRYSDTLLVTFETDSGWQTYASYSGRGNNTLFFPTGTTRVRFEVIGDVVLPLYKGIEITSYVATHFNGEEKNITEHSQILSNFQYPNYYLSLTDIFGNSTITKLHQELSSSKRILYYPNPTYNGIIHLDAVYSEIEIFSSHGKKIKTLYDTDSLDLSHFAKGLYYIKIGPIIFKVVSL